MCIQPKEFNNVWLSVRSFVDPQLFGFDLFLLFVMQKCFVWSLQLIYFFVISSPLDNNNGGFSKLPYNRASLKKSSKVSKSICLLFVTVGGLISETEDISRSKESIGMGTMQVFIRL